MIYRIFNFGIARKYIGVAGNYYQFIFRTLHFNGLCLARLLGLQQYFKPSDCQRRRLAD